MNAFRSLRIRAEVQELFLDAQACVFNDVRAAWSEQNAPKQKSSNWRRFEAACKALGSCLRCGDIKHPDRRRLCETCQNKQNARRRAYYRATGK